MQTIPFLNKSGNIHSKNWELFSIQFNFNYWNFTCVLINSTDYVPITIGTKIKSCMYFKDITSYKPEYSNETSYLGFHTSMLSLIQNFLNIFLKEMLHLATLWDYIVVDFAF